MADRLRVGVLVPNLFVRVPVDEAVRSAVGEGVPLRNASEARTAGCQLVLADLDSLGDDDIRALSQGGCQVVVFAPRVDGERFDAARRAGAVALPRSLFLERLPEILASARAGSAHGA